MTHTIKPLSILLCLALTVSLAAPAPLAQINVTGWHADGQTWIVWDQTAPMPASYRIYASTTDFVVAGSVAAGEEVGRLLPGDWSGARLQIALPGSTYRLPGPGGRTYQLGPNQGVFAYTGHDTTPLYFAVVKDGATAVVASNATGLIAQTLAPVSAHFQGSGLTPGSGQTYHVFAHWFDGHADHTSGRPGYPVMGNASMNGCGSIFIVTLPVSGLPASDAPTVVALHGGGGFFMNFVGGGSPNIGLTFQDALLITSDGTINSVAGIIGASWLGYWEEFDRFSFPFAHPLPDDALIVHYVMRRLLWQIDWVTAQFPVDTSRLSILGHSGGAKGAGTVARVYPERFSAVHLYSASMKAGDQNPVLGDKAQNLLTTLPGSPGIADLASEAFFPSTTERDAAFTRIAIGRSDTVGGAAWGLDKVQSYRDVDATRMGRHLFFDERGHGTSTWNGAYFNGSTMLAASELLKHRVDASYPAFFGDDQDPLTPGTQPDMGNGDPQDGDPYGTFGGYCDWDQSTLVDTPTRWACTFWLTALSANPKDNFPGTTAELGVALRRPQSFLPAAGDAVLWQLLRVSDGARLQVGITIVENDGLVAVDGLIVTKDPERVRLTLSTAGPLASPHVPQLGL
jgi:hypothetical protein